jgi:hypothetical protein
MTLHILSSLGACFSLHRPSTRVVPKFTLQCRWPALTPIHTYLHILTHRIITPPNQTSGEPLSGPLFPIPCISHPPSQYAPLFLLYFSPPPLFSFTSLVCECVVYLLLRECANPTLASDSLTRHRYPPPRGCVACCVLLRLAFACSYFLLLRCNGGLWISFSFLGARFFFRFFLLFSLSLSTMHPSRVCSTVPFRESVITQGTYQTVRGGFTLMLCRLYADRGYGPYPPHPLLAIDEHVPGKKGSAHPLSLGPFASLPPGDHSGRGPCLFVYMPWATSQNFPQAGCSRMWRLINMPGEGPFEVYLL